jgi:hypothetical protein
MSWRRTGTACALALLMAGAVSSAGRARGRTLAVPAAQALRVASLCSARRTEMPTSLPPGYRFAGWQVFAHNVDCDEGFAVRFRRGDARLTWEADGPQTFPLDCKQSPIAHNATFSVFHRVRGGLEKVWACLRNPLPSKIVVFQHVGSGRASVQEMVRMVMSARRPPADRAPGGSYSLASGADLQHMSTRFGAPLIVPRRLPPGFVFTGWAYRARDPNIDGRASLFQTFGRSGNVLGWSVYSGTDKLGLDCPAKGNTKFPRDKPFLVSQGTAIYLRVGIHGGSAWRCIPVGTLGNARPLEVELWYSIQLDSPRMRNVVAALVAEPRIIR